LDLAIQGEGYFCLTDERNAIGIFTRYDHFTVNENDQLIVTLDGKEWPLSPDVQSPPDAVSVMVNSSGLIAAEMPSTYRQSPTNPSNCISEHHFAAVGQIQLAIFKDSRALRQIARQIYASTNNSGKPRLIHLGENGAGQDRQCLLE
jgi:flagellar hook protein FlgE